MRHTLSPLTLAIAAAACRPVSSASCTVSASTRLDLSSREPRSFWNMVPDSLGLEAGRREGRGAHSCSRGLGEQQPDVMVPDSLGLKREGGGAGRHIIIQEDLENSSLTAWAWMGAGSRVGIWELKRAFLGLGA